MASMHPLETKLLADWPASRWRETPILVACSGGADSVALLRAFVRLEAIVSVGHFNHALRGEESDGDEQFVRSLAETLGVQCFVGRATGTSRDEATLRRERYDFLQSTAERTGARYVATAHTADDHAETILHRILRGTGLRGLAGMAFARDLGPAISLVRPLLHVRREEVIDFLTSLGQPFREDSSNQSLDYTRNRIRHELLPLIERLVDPRAREHLLQLGSLAYDAQSTIDALTEELFEASVSIRTPTEASIDCDALQHCVTFTICEVCIRLWRTQNWPMGQMGNFEWAILADCILGDQPKAIMLPGAVRAEKLGSALTLSRG